MKEEKLFHNLSALNAKDSNLHQQVKHNLDHYFKRHENAKSQFLDLENARQRAAAIKNKTLDRLDEYLLDFEKKFLENGGKIIWADTIEEAQQAIKEIISSRKIKSIVKSKSMVSEEIKLNDFLKDLGVENWETDLGEFIQQISHEPPFHLVTPSIHKSESEIAKLFRDYFSREDIYGANDITQAAKLFLRQKFNTADAFVSGANFLLADIGGIAITENEGNVLLGANNCKTHIVISGIEKVIPSVNDLELFWPLLSSYGTGQKITVYNSVFCGPSQFPASENLEERVLILLNNGRTDVLAQKKQRKALGCIRCGACLNVCPVYKTIGGHSYGTVYNGPIGKVLNPWMHKLEKFNHLSYASSLCGACSTACPVEIDLHKLILENRKDIHKKGKEPIAEKISWFVWKEAMMSRNKMNLGGPKAKNFLLKTFFEKSWGKDRDFPQLADKSFNELYREKMGIK